MVRHKKQDNGDPQVPAGTKGVAILHIPQQCATILLVDYLRFARKVGYQNTELEYYQKRRRIP
jgi:hypothetical protein